MKTDNKTLYEISDDAERSILIVWSLTVAVSSLIGDTVILVATTKYHAVKLHKVIVTVMQHMAVNDLLLTTFKVIPGALSLMTNQWVLGELFCHVEENISWICHGAVTLFLTSCMTSLKLIVVTYPLKSSGWSSRSGHRICLLMWFVALAWYAPILIGNLFYVKNTIHFSYRIYNCNYDPFVDHAPAWYKEYLLYRFPVGSILIYTILILTSLLLLVKASKTASQHRTTLRWEGVMAVLLTVLVFLLSYVPWTVVYVAWLVGVKFSNSTFRTVLQMTNMNIMANFFVYALVLRSFRRFLKIKIASALRLVRLSRILRLQPRLRTPYRLEVSRSRRDNETHLSTTEQLREL